MDQDASQVSFSKGDCFLISYGLKLI